jgi:hypothetical protein
MVMHLRPAPPEQVDGMAGDADALYEYLTGGRGWDADKLWWAALDLLFGPGGVAALDGQALTGEVGYSPVMRMPNRNLRSLVASIDGVDGPELRLRFDSHALGEPLGPDVSPGDRDWLCAAAEKLADTLRTSAAAGDDVLFVVA